MLPFTDEILQPEIDLINSNTEFTPEEGLIDMRKGLESY